MNWHKYPFFRLLPPLVAGICLAEGSLSIRPPLAVVYGMVIVVFALLFCLHRLVKEYRHQWVFGVVLMLVMALVGYLRAGLSAPAPLPEQREVYLARVYEPPVKKEKTVKVILDIERASGEGEQEPHYGRVLAYLEKNAQALSLTYGELMVFSANIETVPGPQNPHEFDYRVFLRRRGVTGRVYLKSGEWMPVGVNKGNRVLLFAGHFRDRLLKILKDNGITEDEFGAGAALLLGYDDSLPVQLRQHYVAAGSMHVLCVSGMHVGIIYLLASFILGFVGKGAKMGVIRRVLLLSLIWFYALITGLSPSILRSTLMISMVIFGELFHRRGVLLNAIAASAFIILFINPNDLFSIGFQLSYAAVVGIVLLQRPIYLLIYIENKWLDKVWEITTVSIAAQIATMPFTVFYFNQFTPYFWLSNLVMTPLSFVAILLGMGLLLLSWIPGVSWLVGKMTWASLRLMNWSVASIDHLPLSFVKGVYLNGFEFALALVLLLLLFLLINIRKKRFLLEMLVVSVMLAGSMAFRTRKTAAQTMMVAYSLNKHTAIDFIHGTTHLLLCDERLLYDPSTIDYSLKGAWASWQLPMNPPCYTLDEDVDTDLVRKRGTLVSFQGMLMALVGPSMRLEPLKSPVDVDFLLVMGKRKPDLEALLQVYRPRTLLIDGTVSAYDLEEWKRQSEFLSLTCHVLGEGCFVSEVLR